MPYSVEPGRLCLHGKPLHGKLCKLQMEEQQDGMALACCADRSTMVHCAVQHAVQHAIQHCQHRQRSLAAWYIVLSNMLSNMLSNIVNIASEALLQPMHTHCYLQLDAFLSG